MTLPLSIKLLEAYFQDRKRSIPLTVKITWTKAPSCAEKETPCKTRLRLSAVNMGNSPMEITEMGIRYPRRTRVGFVTIDHPGIVLGPSEEACVYFEIEQMKNLPRYDTFFVKDEAGKIYYPDAGFAARISRFLWWHFGFHPIKD
jgi:hypothetical protein